MIGTKIKYCRIFDGQARLNGRLVFEGNKQDTFLKELYNNLEINYSKFFKMDNLSKLGLLGVELLKRTFPEWEKEEDDAIAVVLQSEYGCMEADVKHQNAIEKGAASPAIFVYTLSNIVIGEISIRNKWFGESIMFIDKPTNLSNLSRSAHDLLMSNRAKYCIIGRLDSYNGQHNLSMTVVTKNNLELIDQEEVIKTIF